LVTDSQIVENEYITDYNDPSIGPIKVVGLPVKFSKTPGAVGGPSPELGQDTDEVLSTICGYTKDQITELRQKEVI
jgi:crotonobetainyl-CoA:carnitine CoA-transferase CaiB-like acyl-CoA transferase